MKHSRAAEVQCVRYAALFIDRLAQFTPLAMSGYATSATILQYHG